MAKKSKKDLLIDLLILLFVAACALLILRTASGKLCHIDNSPTVRNCTFTDNIAPTEKGGGMRVYSSSSTTVENCIFWSNQ